MHTPGLSTHPDLTAIAALLIRLIGQAEAGEWETVALMQTDVCQRLNGLEQAYQSPASARGTSPADRARLAEIIALINKAESACATRREQIAPLVRSLKALPDTTQA